MTTEQLQEKALKYYVKIRARGECDQVVGSASIRHTSKPDRRKKNTGQRTGQRTVQKQQGEKRLEKLMQELQFRDITPEDYDLLLVLDESVKKKTLDQEQLNALPVVELETLLKMREQGEGVVCLVCQDDLIPSDDTAEATVIELPNCKHLFHTECLNTWLLKTSTQCPCCRAEVVVGN